MLGEKYITLLFLNFIKTSFLSSKYFKIFNSDLLNEIFPFFEAIILDLMLLKKVILKVDIFCYY
jgi:hypothetical protein